MENNPWLSIWVRPKATIGQIVAENPNRSLWVLSFIYGFSSLINMFQSFNLGVVFSPVALYFLAAILAPFWGYAMLAIWSWIILWLGRLFKGQATFQQARAAYAWSSVPLALNIPVWIFMGILFGDQVFLNFPDSHLFTDGQIFFLFASLVIKLVAAVWSLVIYFNALAQVQQFSVLRAIGNIVLAGIVAAVAMTLLWMAIFKMIGPAGG